MTPLRSFILPLAAIVATIALVWHGQQPATIKHTTWDDVLEEAKAGGYSIITTENVAELVDKEASSLLLVDTRQEWEYRTGHIEGAVNFSMEPTRWSRFTNAGKLEKFLGPDKNRTLVFY